MKKVELEEKIERLEREIADIRSPDVDGKIQKHKDGYIHIPFSWGGFYRGLACLGGFLLMILNSYSLYYFWNRFNVGECFKSVSEIVVSKISFDTLFFLYPLFIWFFSVWFFVLFAKFG